MADLWLIFNHAYLLIFLEKERFRENQVDLGENKTEYLKK